MNLNLLPKEYADRLKSIYQTRFWTVFLIASGAVLISLLLSMIPTLLITNTKEAITIERLGKIKNSREYQQREELKEEISILSRKVDLLDSIASKKVTNLIDSISSKKTEDIKIDGFGLFQDKTGEIFTVSGVASNRNSLLAFSDSLQDKSLFSSIDLPVSAFSKDQDISFRIEMKLK